MLSGLTLIGCANVTSLSVNTDAPKCSGAGFGLSAAPTAATQALRQELVDADALTLDALLDDVAAGKAAAVAELGLRYANGRDLPQDAKRSVELFAYLAEIGNPLGQYFLAVAYLNGAGVERNDTKAIWLLEESAKQGYDNAQHWLGLAIGQGRAGISPNWCAAVPLFKAAANTISEAAFVLGALYHSGDLGYVDYPEAAKWYRKAIKADMNIRAQLGLRQMIENHLIAWQEGDPGEPAKPRN
ncbi:MAG: tetratricopeptide repeat protein [Rhodospirillaceae bacterium]|nr:tetratricopeptide repeat protein [Rhodospirillaceae bacterium]